MTTTTGTVREMPRVLFPGQGEAFPSWMLRLAARLHLDPSTLMTRTGLVDVRRAKVDEPVGYGITLTEQQRANLSFATRTDAGSIDATLMSSWDGGPITFANLVPGDRDSLRKVALYQWAYFSSSHACGDCLQEDGWRWSLTWRLPWHFACPRHGRFLAARCPRCDQPFMLAARNRIYGPPLASRVPVPEQCNNPLPRGVAVRARTAVACGHPLHDLPTPPVAPAALLTAQDTLLDHLQRRDRDHSWWTDLRAVAALLMRFLDPATVDGLLPGLPDPVRAAVDDHWVTISDKQMARAVLSDHRRGPRSRSHTDTPDDPVLFAPYAALALSAVTSVPDRTGPGLAALRSLNDSVRQHTSAGLAHLLRERDATPPLVALVAAFSNRNAILTSAPAATTNLDGAAPARPAVQPRHIPWLWWPDRFDAVRGLFPKDMTEDFARAYLSLAAAKVLTSGTWTDAADAVGWYSTEKVKHTANSNVSRLRVQGTLDDVHGHVHETLADLAASPDRVDYLARRAQLAALTSITFDQWEELAAAADCHLKPTTWRLRGVAAWMWEQHGLNPLDQFPGFAAAGNPETAREMYRRFRNESLPTLEPVLPAWSATVDLSPPTRPPARPSTGRRRRRSRQPTP